MVPFVRQRLFIYILRASLRSSDDFIYRRATDGKMHPWACWAPGRLQVVETVLDPEPLARFTKKGAVGHTLGCKLLLQVDLKESEGAWDVVESVDILDNIKQMPKDPLTLS